MDPGTRDEQAAAGSGGLGFIGRSRSGVLWFLPLLASFLHVGFCGVCPYLVFSPTCRVLSGVLWCLPYRLPPTWLSFLHLGFCRVCPYLVFFPMLGFCGVCPFMALFPIFGFVWGFVGFAPTRFSFPARTCTLYAFVHLSVCVLTAPAVRCAGLQGEGQGGEGVGPARVNQCIGYIK